MQQLKSKVRTNEGRSSFVYTHNIENAAKPFVQRCHKARACSVSYMYSAPVQKQYELGFKCILEIILNLELDASCSR